jgi:hypothetical protein
MRTPDLSPGQRSLVDLMQVHQFGRIENMQVRDGLPVLNQETMVVRITRLGGEGGRTHVTYGDNFELKSQIRVLFDELAQLGNAIVTSLEFRHGLPFLLETTAHFVPIVNQPKRRK